MLQFSGFQTYFDFPTEYFKKSPPLKSQIPETYVQKWGPIKKWSKLMFKSAENPETARNSPNHCVFQTKMVLGGACLLACHFPPLPQKTS